MSSPGTRDKSSLDYPHPSRLSITGFTRSPLVMALLLSALTISTTASFAGACSCIASASIDDAVGQSTLVFLGKVRSVTVSKLREAQNEVLVRVIRVFKDEVELSTRYPGIGSSEADTTKSVDIVLYTAVQESLCGYPFAQEQDYLIFARGNLARLSVSLCSRTKLLDAAGEDMQALEQQSIKENSHSSTSN